MRVRYSIRAVVVSVAAVVLAGAAAVAAGQRASVVDPAGDVKNKVEPWLDIVSGAVERRGNTFTFSMRMAAALPADPPAAPGDLGSYYWEWGIDTDPDLAPEGYPFPSTHVATHDFMVLFVSDGEDYFALVVDRRPLVLGQEPIITVVPSRVDGAVMQVFVDAELLDDPAEFQWRLGTAAFHSHLGTEGFQLFDRYDGGYVPWPSH
jgi:hypothetical protein